MLEAPKYIAKSGVIGSATTFKWNDDISIKITSEANDKILDAIDLSNHKAKMALGALFFEWITRRLEGLTVFDISDAYHRLWAAWAGAIDPHYMKPMEVDLSAYPKGISDTSPPDGALQDAYLILDGITSRYKDSEVYLAESTSKMATLANHILPKSAGFSKWLSETLKKTAQTFPLLVDIDDYYDNQIYDASNDPPVYRAFFEPDFVHNEENAKQAINEFLQSLDHENNPYLYTAEEMIANGFQGTPYQH